MVGDDIVSDVGGAQAAGIRGVQVSDSLSTMMGKCGNIHQVRTGKFRPERDEHHPTVTPDLIVDNLKALVDIIVQGN